MKIIAIAGFCIFATIICKGIEQNSREIKLVAVLAVLGIIVFQSLSFFSGLIGTFKELFDQAEIDNMYLEIIFKCLGICYIVQLASDYCKDCGENSISTQVQFAGRLALLSISLPLFNALIEIVKTLLL